MEIEFKGTPGPWVADGLHIKVQDRVPHGMAYVQHFMSGVDGFPDTVGLSNAQLMASAPELLEACQKARSIFLELTEQGKYPEMCLAINGGEGLGFLKKAIDKALNPKL